MGVQHAEQHRRVRCLVPLAVSRQHFTLLCRERRVTTVATVVLGDDHVVFLDALSTVLTQHGHSVGAVARSVTEMIGCVRLQQPDLCLINWHSAADDRDGSICRVIAVSPGTSVLVLSASAQTEAVARALNAGASGYLHKSRGISALVSAIERVQRGEVVVDVPQAPATRRPAPADDAHRLAAHLTARERECLAMLVEGLDTAAMIAKLGVSRPTVRTHVQAVLNKLGVHSRLEAASFAVRTGVLDAWYDDNLRNRRAVLGHPARVPDIRAQVRAG